MEQLPERELIRNILFDLGGVLLDIDYHKTIEAFKQLGADDAERLYSQDAQKPLFDELEIGKIHEEGFFETLRANTGIEATNVALRKAWCAMLGNMEQPIVHTLEKLHATHRLALLSNTNSIHQRVFEQTVETAFGWDHFRQLFEGIFYSHQIGMRKPHPETFLSVTEKLGWNASDTLFIDDSLQHVQGAAKAGLKVYWLKDGVRMDALFSGWM